MRLGFRAVDREDKLMNQKIYIIFFILIGLAQACSFDDALDTGPSLGNSLELNLNILSQKESPFANRFSPDQGISTSSQADIIRELLAIFPNSTLVDLDDISLRSIAAWRIKLKLATEARLIFYVAKELGTIFRIDGTTPPYTYALDAGSNFITLNEAFQTALNVEGGSVRYWRLGLDNSFNWSFFIFIENQDGVWEIQLGAQGEGVFNALLNNPPSPNDNDNSLDNVAVSQSILNRAQAMFSGQIFHADIDPSEIQEAYLENNEGALVEFRFSQNNQELIQIEGETPPFNYELIPENDLVPFGQITDTLSKISTGDICQWHLEKDNNFAGRWIYKVTFSHDNQSTRIYFDALSKEIVLNESLRPQLKSSE